MAKVSVIMPSYNVAPYIRECMESVIGQTLKDIEILCVDAGSTDGTREILEEYAGKDKRIKLLQADMKSYGYQMNLGLREASGEYIGIVETDDFILSTMYEELYGYAKEKSADFVKSDFDVFTDVRDGERLFLRFSLKKYSNVRYDTVFSSEDYVDSKQTVDVFIWNGIYKKAFLQEHRIWFQETPGAAFQDCGFRYQVALYVERGFFVDASYYRYRRSNINSSTYNNKCVLYNLAECKNLLRIYRGKWEADDGRAAFLAREMAVIALRPYVELLRYGQGAEGTKEALGEFRDILTAFLEQGVLEQAAVAPGLWLEIRMLVENLDLYDYYAHIKAAVEAEAVQKFLERVAGKKQVVIFGSGYIGSCAYCMIRNHGIGNVVAFCDNDQGRWDSRHMGCTVISPKEAAERFSEAYFVIANAVHQDEMQRQLYHLGIYKRQITKYNLSSHPLECTNMIMRRIG